MFQPSWKHWTITENIHSCRDFNKKIYFTQKRRKQRWYKGRFWRIYRDWRLKELSSRFKSFYNIIKKRVEWFIWDIISFVLFTHLQCWMSLNDECPLQVNFFNSSYFDVNIHVSIDLLEEKFYLKIDESIEFSSGFFNEIRLKILQKILNSILQSKLSNILKWICVYFYRILIFGKFIIKSHFVWTWICSLIKWLVIKNTILKTSVYLPFQDIKTFKKLLINWKITADFCTLYWTLRKEILKPLLLPIRRLKFCKFLIILNIINI